MPFAEVEARHGLRGVALTTAVRTAATAVDKTFKCASCGEERVIENRGGFHRRVYEGYRCDTCKRRRNYARPRDVDVSDVDLKTLQERTEFLRRIIGRKPVCDFAQLGYVDASILYAILRTSDREFSGDPFIVRFFDGLTADLILRLFRLGALQVCSQTTVHAVRYNRKGKIQADPYRLVWTLAPDVNGLGYMQILKCLKDQSETAD
jgi:predicted RNA-binding Zn-ribbon protein involved in translation (DUF1610 family)